MNSDIISIVLKFVNTKTLLRAKRVSKLWYKTIVKNLWRYHINLSGTKVTDAGLVHLKGVKRIDLRHTKVTDTGVVHLRSIHTIVKY